MSGFGNREDRIGDPPMCDKAWHLCAGVDPPGPQPAAVVLLCSVSMRAHMRSCYDRDKRRRVMPGREAG